MEESWFQKDEVISRLATKGKDYSENDKSALKEKQQELLRLIGTLVRGPDATRS